MEKGTCKMGWFVRSKINQQEGFVVGKIYWMFGCEKILIKPLDRKANSIFDLSPNEEVVSEEYLEIISDKDNTTYEKDFVTPNLNKYFGMLCRDKVSGYEGVCIGCTTTLYGTDAYCLEPIFKKKRNSTKIRWFDVGRLEIIRRQVEVVDVTDKKPGGCALNMDQTLSMNLC